MPVLPSTMPGMASKPLYRGYLTITSASLTQPSIAAPLPGGIPDDRILPPAAPPSAVQMQIKALISEQVLGLEAAKEATTNT